MSKSQNKNNSFTLKGKVGDNGVTKNLETSKFLKSYPWLKSNGTFKSDEEISQLGKTWSSETWNAYLEASVGKLEDDELVFFPYMDTETMLKGGDVLEMLTSVNEYTTLHDALKFSLKSLTPNESRVIYLRYWKNKDNVEIAEIMKVSRNTVKKLRQRALDKLKKLLPSKEFRDRVKRMKSKEKSEILSPRCHPDAPKG